MLKIYVNLHIKDLLFLSDFNETWTFLTDLKKYSSIKCNEICPVKARLFLVDGQTDMMKLRVAFHNFVYASNNIKVTQTAMHNQHFI